MATFLRRMFAGLFAARAPLRRYRVTPRRNPRVFRREVLAAVLHDLRHDSVRTLHG
jgi:hypothetical protein